MLEIFHLTSTTKREPLRIGLMMDSLTLPAWAASIVDHIQQCNFARIESVILNAASGLVGAAVHAASLIAPS